MKHFFYSLLCISTFVGYAQTDYVKEIRAYQAQLNQEFANTAESPLTSEGLAVFDSLRFFPIDSSFRVWAKLERTPDSLPFEMRTTTSRLAVYRQYALLHFTLRDTLYSLPVYESIRLKKLPGYEDYLFLPFTDLTNGGETYGGGRFLDLRMPEGDSIEVDFNKAYNPYCAYNHRYSCPIPPRQNHMPTYIKAGVLAYEDNAH